MPPQDTATLPRLRVFAETVDHRVLRSAAVLEALATRGLQLVLAVRPGDNDPLPVLAAAREAGVCVAVWPMLGDADGRWASSANASRFADHARRHLAALERAGYPPDELCLDLEPPLAVMRRAIDRGAMLGRVGGERARCAFELERLIADAAAHGVPTWGTVVPLILADERQTPSWQRLLGTPVDALSLRRVSVMLYTSMMVGYSRGALRRRDAEYLLAAAALRARERFGARASVALGAVGRGALGDEATYLDTDELRTDVAIARAAGIEDLALFELAGALARPRWQEWLDALVEPSATSPVTRASRRARLVWWTSAAVSRLAGVGR